MGAAMRNRMRSQQGFSMIEMVLVVFVFTTVTAAVFVLLDVAQQRYRMESEFLDSFQGARLGLDQMVRDIHAAGYPPGNSFQAGVNAGVNVTVAPFAWSPGYPAAPCNIPGCAIPGDFDLIIETDIDPQNANGVEWVRYQLRGTTLMRGVTPKGAGDPSVVTLADLVPYVENVMNNPGAQEIANLQIAYANAFPGGAAVPIFNYAAFDTGKAATPQFLREINITLMVRSPRLDPKTRQPRLVTLNGRVRRINPSE
jgi:prepilin-type N-terminal cleavage/methylation domain-containing protein